MPRRGRFSTPEIEHFTISSGNFNDSYTTGDGSDVLAGGGGNDTLDGAGGIDQLDGGTGNDVLDGGVGLDTLIGGAGNDTFVLGSENDKITETAGIDTITSTITRSLAAFGKIENLTLLGNANINGTGHALANTLTGNAGKNTLKGDAGNDVVSGGHGNDILAGGLGKDVMTGGAGDDDFDFNAVTETGKTAATRDAIKDFVTGRDDIDLSGIDASPASGNGAFSFLALKGATFTGEKGQLRWLQENPAGTANDKTIVEGDINGDKKADFQIELTGLVTLSKGDFIL